MDQFDYLEFALLGEVSPDLPTRQFVGVPPGLTGGVDQRQAMPPAKVLVLMRESDGSIFLYRFAADGAAAGDTWHAEIAEAKGQAAFEYGNAVGVWCPVPADVTDISAFVRSLGREGEGV
jgi:hypothetical protein